MLLQNVLLSQDKRRKKSAVFCYQNDHLLFLIREIYNKMVQTDFFLFLTRKKPNDLETLIHFFR